MFTLIKKLRSCLIILFILSIQHNCIAQQTILEKGISLQLATQRASTISDISYSLSFTIPEKITDPIAAQLVLKLNLHKATAPLILDFNTTADHIRSIENTKGEKIAYKFINEHIIIPVSVLKQGEQSFKISFTAGDQSLNRNKEYLYTLFVPARASTAFPCFDQPDLKATFSLKLETPANWLATSNGKLENESSNQSRAFYTFAPTRPISTYLFSFVTGKFKKATRLHNATTYAFYYREADSAKMSRNMEAIFNQVFLSVDWMENYTGIKQPFDKYDFVAIPSFQYGGMEHPGAILYNAQRIILDESATQDDELNRANLIAHETAHLWFGDMVTMKWFNDVWLKEVFANFIADKIVNPMYPGMNHNLRFLLAHQPRAYAIDRTLGANPIQQQLSNLNDAGSLYGNIIYHKSPVVMNQLEQLMGSDNFRQGLQKYLHTFAYGNATWDDLVSILSGFTTQNLKEWSTVWVKEPGMPHYAVSYTQPDGHSINVTLVQTDPLGKNRIWPQYLNILVNGRSGDISQEIYTNKKIVTATIGSSKPLYILPSSNEKGYGYFELDPMSTTYLLQNIGKINDPLLRGSAWLSLREMMIDRKISSADYFNTLCSSVKEEKEEQLINFLVSDLQTTFWRYLTPLERTKSASTLENLLWIRLNGSEKKSLKSVFLKALISTSITDSGVDSLYAIWNGNKTINGLKLSDNDYRGLACELALRNYPDANKILSTQIARIKDKDLKARLEYLLPSLSNNKEDRDQFFKQLKNPTMREHEPWTAEALSYLNHPLRASVAEEYILPGLEMVEEIRSTGDIFFPADWLNALLSGHCSPKAAKTIRTFLSNHPDYPPDLRIKILQSADNLFRKNK
jgi:aminopeptidase N